MPKEKAWLQFTKWAEEYGPIYSLMLGPSNVTIVLSSDQAVKDLLDKRSGIYSSRPPLYIGQMISGWMRMVLMEYGKTWRTMRSLVHDHLNLRASDSYVPYQDLENRQMLLGFLEQPNRWRDHIRRYTNALTTQIIFGFRTIDINDKNMHALFEPCFSADLVQAQKKEDLSDNLASYLLGSLHEAGSDTTWSTLIGFIQAMLLYPDVARKAQEDLDRVCGDRLPILEDGPQLQYIRGCVKESLRWMPTVILGAPRAVMKDDMYLGYRIPKGATIMMNVWALHNDEEHFPNPRVFDPSRYANDFQSASEAAHNPDFSQRDHYTFGAGRRLCQGMHIAERSLFLAVARLLWAFDFQLQKDENGVEIRPDADALTDGVLVRPKEFPVEIVVRSEERAKAVRREWGKVEGKLDEKGQWKRVPEGMFSKEYVPLVA
ncbi:hypothetical protein N0V90_011187 [Kalmusia sp. IMI 367209]|nr:hypothetical protein N0V90_011187 [Kalmusia sp. IMI 367209]